MRIVIVGGGISAAYLANNLKKQDGNIEVLIVSDEKYPPYDRIHLCKLLDKSGDIDSITLALDPTIKLELQQKIVSIEPLKKHIYSKTSMYSYDKLIIATGSIPRTLFDIEHIDNATVFRSVRDCKLIEKHCNEKKHLVLIGSGPIGLELLETLNAMESVEKITLINRGSKLYEKNLSNETVKIMENCFKDGGKVTISYNDEIVDKLIVNNTIEKLITKKLEIEDPFVVFGIGITPNIEEFKTSLVCERGIVVNRYMETNHKDIYALGECAQIKDEEFSFISGHVKECTIQASIIINHILKKECEPFVKKTSIDMLKVGKFDLVDVSSSEFGDGFEKVVLSSKKDNRIDEYFIKDEKLVRFIGLNSNVDVNYIESLMESKSALDINYLYQNRIVGEKGRLICSCENIYYQDLEELIVENGIDSFYTLNDFSQVGRVCGRCKGMVEDIIINLQDKIDPHIQKQTPKEKQKEYEYTKAKKRIEKFNKIHPFNKLTDENLDAAFESLDISKDEVNRWISMVTATMNLDPVFENLVNKGVKTLNKLKVIWLELADCSGNSEAFIKSTNPSIEDLLFDYISLDYHELLMSASGDQSETVLENIISQDKGEYILIVEGAVPLGLDGKFLRIGPKGETGLNLLQRCAKDAALIIGVGSCAFDGGVVAAEPNPTGAVGVGEALGRSDVINLPGCPVNPVNIVGTLLSYIMFEEKPKLDKFNRPLWAYEGRVHDNCERRGHYELGEFVKEWGDEGAKKGWCLFEMGCKGPYANANCSTMKFNQGTSWPVQVGHGCMACVEQKFFDKYAHERVLKTHKEQ